MTHKQVIKDLQEGLKGVIMTEHERVRKELWLYSFKRVDVPFKGDNVVYANSIIRGFDETFPPSETKPADYAELEKERDELKKALKEVWDICIEDTPWNKSAIQENTVSYLYERLESFRDLIIDKDNT